MLTLLVTAIGVIFTATLQSPGVTNLADATLPLTYGFSRMFNLSYKQAMWLTFPAMLGNFYGFVWAYGRQLSSMAKSGLLPKMFGYMTKTTDTPYVSLLAGTLLCLLLAFISYYDLFYVMFKEDVKHMYMLASYVIYVFLFISYIVFKEKYSSLTRSFTSPLGIYGAILGLAIFVIDVVCLLVYLDIQQVPLFVLIIATVFMTIYYFLVLHGNQQFSEEEKEKLFKAYLINGKVHISEL